EITLPASGPVYVDSSAVIYYVEKIESYHSAGVPLWDALAAGQLQVVASDLTLLEVLVKPVRDGDATLVTHYEGILLGTAGLTCVSIGRPILNRAAQIRALDKLKTPDAIHAATALETLATMFVTNDFGFRRVSGLNFAVLGEIAAQ